MQEEFLENNYVLPGLSRFISKHQAKLLEHYLMFLFLPLLFLVNINIFLNMVFLSALFKISRLDSKIAHLEFYKSSSSCVPWPTLNGQKMHYIHQGESRPSLPSLTTQKFSHRKQRKHTQKVKNFAYHQFLSCISSTAQLQEWFNRIITRTLFDFIISSWG